MSAALLILAAGLGTRFKGGIKQLTPVGRSGELLMEYSVYDAISAGFDKVIFVIRRDIEGQLRHALGDRLSKHISVEYCFQDTELPEGIGLPEIKRGKPWGTVHAVLSAKNAIGNSPFLIVNSDDYYGEEAYKSIYDFLTSPERNYNEQCMGGFVLKNTLSSSGTVNRGICTEDRSGRLVSVTETYKIARREDGNIVGERGGSPIVVPEDSIVSMNMWGFDPSMLCKLEGFFRNFLESSQAGGTLETAECILPMAVDELIKSGDISVKVLPTCDKWFGMTYKEDLGSVSEEFRLMSEDGRYPLPLFC